MTSNILSWKVKYFDVNNQVIKDYDVLKNKDGFIKLIKKKCANKEEFSEKMRKEMMHYYWARCEWELIIVADDDNTIWLYPWAGCREPEKVKIDATNIDENFNWQAFAAKHIMHRNEAKIDIFDQLEWMWDEFIDYCWNTRLKYERKRKANV